MNRIRNRVASSTKLGRSMLATSSYRHEFARRKRVALSLSPIGLERRDLPILRRSDSVAR